MFYEEIGLIDKSKGENQNITDLPNEKYPIISQFRTFLKLHIKKELLQMVLQRL